MIPYDELVGALANWRAKQGLPVVQTPRISSPVTEGYAANDGGFAAPAPAPPRTAPPMAAPQPSRITKPVETQVAPDHTVEESLDVEDAALLEEAHYEPEGDDFEMAFGRAASATTTGEATTVGQPPAPGAGTGDTTLDENDTSDLPPPPRPTMKKRTW
ncbi:MAG: hypothetical protein WKG01_21680 [Kofleriaceae bacterium]